MNIKCLSKPNNLPFHPLTKNAASSYPLHKPAVPAVVCISGFWHWGKILILPLILNFALQDGISCEHLKTALDAIVLDERLLTCATHCTQPLLLLLYERCLTMPLHKLQGHYFHKTRTAECLSPDQDMVGRQMENHFQHCPWQLLIFGGCLLVLTSTPAIFLLLLYYLILSSILS